MLLIFPPVAKPCEPPAGVALLSAALKEKGLCCDVIDGSIEGLMYLINSDIKPVDSWSKRALKNREQIIFDLQDPKIYTNMDRYHQRVYDLNKLLTTSIDSNRFKITLSDYADNQLSSVSSQDLLKSARTFSENPFYSYFEQKLGDRIASINSEYIGISLCYLNQALVAFALAGWIKARFKNRKIVMGGGLVSSWMSQPSFSDPFKDLIDVLIKGEGEEKLLNLFGKTGEKRHYVPDYDFSLTNDYLAPGRILPFRSAIGCYWSKCNFCPEKAETRPYNSKKPDQVVDDLRIIDTTYHPDYIHFIDNAMTPAFLKRLAQYKFGFKWYGFVRFEKEFLDLEFCKNLKRSGCDMLKLGLESGDQSVLDMMNKGTRLETVSIMLKNLRQSGILTFVYLLFGTSYENEISANQTLEFVNDHKSYIDYLNLAVFNLPRFSEDAQGLETKEFYHGDLSLYLNFNHPQGWDRRKVKQFLDKQFKKRVISRSNIRKNPAFFSSNHAVFFNQPGAGR
jgi:radical SAM superfamily enzyme YgiQ (UPF0313 family)